MPENQPPAVNLTVEQIQEAWQKAAKAPKPELIAVSPDMQALIDRIQENIEKRG